MSTRRGLPRSVDEYLAWFDERLRRLESGRQRSASAIEDNTIAIGSIPAADIHTHDGAGAGSTIVGGVAETDPGIPIASGENSTGIGDFASATGAAGISIGALSSASGEGGTAIGAAITGGTGAVAAGVASVALGGAGDVYFAAGAYGEATVAIGPESFANELGALAIGLQAYAEAEYAVAVGDATATGDSSIAIGRFAVAGNQSGFAGGVGAAAESENALALGTSAYVDVDGLFGMALGYGAQVLLSTAGVAFLGGQCGDDDSFAMGRDSVTSAVKQIQIADRHFELEEISDPGAPAADHGRLYVKDNGAGKTQLIVQFSSGGELVLATQP